MKIRNGFVSNSSTSSFLIYGVMIEKSDLRERLCKDEEDEGEDGDSLYEKMDKLASKHKALESHCPDYSDEYFVGLDLRSMKDDETMGQFKERVGQVLKDALGDKLPELRWHEAAWRDG